MDYTTFDDEALLRLISHQQTDALSALYDRYGRLVFSLALQMMGEVAVAEEITQDVFLRVWEKAHTYRSDQARVSTWITSITRYRSIDLLRRRKSRPDHTSLAWDDLPLNAIPVAEGDPEDMTELSMRRKRVRAAIAMLPTEQKKVLALAYFKGLTHSEIAELLGNPLGTVKTRIRAGMQKLRDILKDEFPLDL
ncbi:MAG: sigma-70 family RNA polymerase sigma factor [Anaerolineales bacterium]